MIRCDSVSDASSRSLHEGTIWRRLRFRLQGPGLQRRDQLLFRLGCGLVATWAFVAGHQTDGVLNFLPIWRELLEQPHAPISVEDRKRKALLGDQFQYFSSNLTRVGRSGWVQRIEQERDQVIRARFPSHKTKISEFYCGTVVGDYDVCGFEIQELLFIIANYEVD